MRTFVFLLTFVLFVSCVFVAESKYHVSTRRVVADFTGGLDIYDNIEHQISDLDIGVLG